ncbi:MAG: MFS transporter, partial [Actinomycetota bacterium]|nr:MFS transporter [Actinomycetota bacterium]
AGGLLAVAVLPGLAGITPAAYNHPADLSTGFHHAMLIAAVLCALGGVLSFLLVASRKDSPVTLDGPPVDDRPPPAAARCPIAVPHAHP